MVKSAISTKEMIMDSAILLFNTKGYDGTSIRDISNKARVNPANIAYYFHNKQGLLEACLIYFFENYISFLEEEANAIQYEDRIKCLKRAIQKILIFQGKNHLLTRFVWREISIDSQVIREVISSYLMKERYLFKCLLEEDDSHQTFINMKIIQLKSMITMPFLNSQYLREVLHMFPQEKYFIDKYFQVLEEWIDQMLSDKVDDTKLINAPF
ncbi:forespore capture DNA-binding protein RefZ [Bacillus sp. FJAT-49736]|uniref:forespore capture DNA-binding protein RefZ n=1 Tax=Bacillus sp. FJAT-49736 TaxID=2833582 RepID=UPI001BC96DCE|nr:forespore capture DNA-binding protein RefZ [Bacillus sp. FJAT-49736]MBS4173827.1 forespore capture DNA-binding protein RefZ [Bacillus sp. FJAT-49736]